MGADCSDYLSQLYEYLDGELDEAVRSRLRAHLDDCPPCLDECQRDALLKSLVRRSCQCEQAPDQLRTQILARLTTVRVTTVHLREG